MWTVIYMAQSKQVVENLRELLEGHDILVKIRSINRDIDEDNCGYEILVPESEVSQAHEILIEAEL